MKEGKDLLEQFLAKIQINIEAERKKQDVYQLWYKVIPDELKNDTKIIEFENGILLIACAHPAFQQELQLTESEWRSDLEELIGKKIKKVKYRKL